MFSKLTWADYVALVALLRGLYIGYKSGFFHELLRLVCYIITIAVTFLFYQSFAQKLTLDTPLNQTMAEIIAFCAVLIVTYFMTVVVRLIIVKLLKVGEGGAVNRILGMTIGAVRWLLLMSFLFMAVDHSPLKQLQEDVHTRSLTGDKIAMAAPMLLEYLSQLSPELAAKKTP